MGTVIDTQATAHAINNPVTDRQPKPSADTHRFSGEERLENPLEQPRLDPAAVVLDPQPHPLLIGVHTQGDPWLLFALCQQSIAGIDQQVDQHLLQLILMTTDRALLLGRVDP
ncbi:hypothetical protein D3C78_743160 [compost metagenome]